MDKNKKILTILITLTIIFTAIGSSLAYLSWVSSEEQKTQITEQAKLKGYDLVLSKNMVLYGGKDITAELVKTLK